MDDPKKADDAPGTSERSFTGGDTRIVDDEQPIVVEEEMTIVTLTGGDTR